VGAPDQDTARAIEGLHVIKAGSHASGSGTSLVAGGVQPLDPVHPAGAEVELHGVRIGVGVQVERAEVGRGLPLAEALLDRLRTPR
jgi:hypothetical protein